MIRGGARTGPDLASAAVAGGVGTHAEPTRAAGVSYDGADWPDWAQPQLRAAVQLADAKPGQSAGNLASLLYRDWFAAERDLPPVPNRPLAGLYREAHAAMTRPTGASAIDAAAIMRAAPRRLWVVSRHDALGLDGWWRTWGAGWKPAEPPSRLARVYLTPDTRELARLVHTITDRLLDGTLPWLLVCPTVPRRLSRAGSVVLCLDADQLAAAEADVLALIDALTPALRDGTPPLCRPLGVGAAIAEDPAGPISFGQQRCQLIASALAEVGKEWPLTEVASAFRARGIDPAAPHRTRPWGTRSI